MEKLYCPMFFAANKTTVCRKDKCAWWDEGNMNCAILSIAQYLCTTAQRLEKSNDS